MPKGQEKPPHIKKKLAKKGLSKLNRDCSLEAFKHNVRREYHAGQTAQGTQHVAIGLSVLKRSCGVQSKDRMTPKEIVAAGKRKKVMNLEAINGLLTRAIGHLQEAELEIISESVRQPKTSRPGPHWNPFPKKKTTTNEFIKTLETIARINPKTNTWSKKTADLIANIAWAIKKGDKERVEKLWKMLAEQSDVSQGLINEINHWLQGWMK